LIENATPAYLPRIVVFGIHTGCRRKEILSADWQQNINMQDKVITIAISKLKPGEKTRFKIIPMSEVLYEMLLEMSKDNMSGRLFPVTVSALKDAFERAVRKAGLDDFRFHDLRHTFGTRLAQMGKSLSVIQALMGHLSIVTTQRYVHHCPSSLRGSAKAMDDYYKSGFCHNLITAN
jgi:integrase